jgi:hypothetical protein
MCYVFDLMKLIYVISQVCGYWCAVIFEQFSLPQQVLAGSW